MNNSLTIFADRVGDRNDRGMAGAQVIGDALAEHLRAMPVRIGEARPPLCAHWDVELAAAQPALRLLAAHMEQVQGGRPVTAMGRCAAGLATLPVMARHHPDAAVVWFDAHGDCNTPETSQTGYLGGLVLTGAAGRWDSGLGDDLDLSNVILVGARDLDAAEQALIDRGELRLVAVGPDLSSRLADAVAGRPVYVHLDCDVLEPGIVPTEFAVPGGLSLNDLRGASQVLARSPLIGLEIAEFEDRWAHSGRPGSPSLIIEALEPLLRGRG